MNNLEAQMNFHLQGIIADIPVRSGIDLTLARKLSKAMESSRKMPTLLRKTINQHPFTKGHREMERENPSWLSGLECWLADDLSPKSEYCRRKR